MDLNTVGQNIFRPLKTQILEYLKPVGHLVHTYALPCRERKWSVSFRRCFLWSCFPQVERSENLRIGWIGLISLFLYYSTNLGTHFLLRIGYQISELVRACSCLFASSARAFGINVRSPSPSCLRMCTCPPWCSWRNPSIPLASRWITHESTPTTHQS